MFSSLTGARVAVRSVVADIDVAALDARAVTAVLAEVTAMEQSLAAMRVRLGRRGEETNAWLGTRQRTAAGWLAETTGTSVGEATRTIETAKALDKLPEVGDAFADGRLSEAQAREIGLVGEAAEDRQAELIDKAAEGSFRHLRDHCREIKAQAESEVDEKRRLRRMHSKRGAHWSVETDGAHVLHTRFGPEQGPIAKAHHDAEVDGIFRHATRSGRRETFDNYGADAVFNLMTGRTVDGTLLDQNPGESSPTAPGPFETRTGPALGDRNGAAAGTTEDDIPVPAPTREGRQLRARAEIIFLVDYKSWLRGTTAEGETCEIAGLGPVPVVLAERFAHDAFLKAVVTDGTDIGRVKHFGRSIPAELKTALFVRDRGCAVPGCTNQLAIEIDHRHPYGHGGELSLTNGDSLCRPHHRDKTHNGHRLRGQPGDRRWTDKTGNVLAADRTTADPPSREADRAA